MGVGQDIVVPNSNNPKPLLFKKACANFVFRNLLHMLPAINFDDE